MDFDLRAAARKKLLLVAHRGACGGNIPCNTIAAFEAAVRQGADMIEIDIQKSADGELFIFHPGMEKAHLGIDADISRMTSAEIRRLRYINSDLTETQFGLNTLTEVLEHFKGRCFINCDKYWMYPREITRHIRSFNMSEQILVKTRAEKELFDIIEECAPDMQYMVLVNGNAEQVHNELKHRKINYMGQELIFETEDSPLCSEAYLNKLREDNILSWVNTIVYYYIRILSAGHNDDVSVTGNPGDGWGWCARRGFDLIQTDWVLACRQYLAENGLLYRQ